MTKLSRFSGVDKIIKRGEGVVGNIIRSAQELKIPAAYLGFASARWCGTYLALYSGVTLYGTLKLSR